MHGEAASSLITVSRAEPDNKEERETFQEQGVFFWASICEDSVESPELALANAHLVTCELAGGRFVLISESTLLNALLPEHHGAARTAAEPGSGRRCVPDYYCFSPLPALKVGPDSGLGCDCVVYSDEDMDLVRQQV